MPSYIAAILLVSGCFLLASAAETVYVDAKRASNEPILNPREPNPTWSDFALFNPAAIKVGSKTVLLFRAQDRNHTSRIGYAESQDGLHFRIRHEPVLSPEAPYEKGGGVEDPRLLKIGNLFYLTYTGYNLHDAQLCLATSSDLIHWRRVGILLPAYKGAWNTQWTKSGAIVPEKINGKWWMYYLGTKKDSDGKSRDYMGLASSSDLIHWNDATDNPVLDRRPGAFDSRVMEPGPSPLITDAGILLLYNGATEGLVYSPGWVLFDKHDPRRVIERADKPFIVPVLPWEKTGNVPNVIFLEGVVSGSSSANSHKFGLLGYYGAGDKYVGAMKIQISFSGN